MGIKVEELLQNEYFRHFRVIAGRDGIEREIQGITLFEAPDCYKWGIGKEMVLSTGYVIMQDPDCIRRMFNEGYCQWACMVVKCGRFLNPVPQSIIDEFDAHGVPLIEMPFSIPWMDLMNQVNVIVMNRIMKRFMITNTEPKRYGNSDYKKSKISQILRAVEQEMNFPACLIDTGSGQVYYSSTAFEKGLSVHHFEAEDFWNPSFPHSKATLCDTTDLVRYRIVEEAAREEIPFSWITVPIRVNKTIQAYFVVLESRNALDYYDQYAIRIAMMELQSMYEQSILVQSMRGIGFENFIHFAMSGTRQNEKQLMTQASTLNLNLGSNYYFILGRQMNTDISMADYREELTGINNILFPRNRCRLAFLETNEILMLADADQEAGSTTPGITEDAYLWKQAEAFGERVKKAVPESRLVFGFFSEKASLVDTKRNIARCRRALSVGSILYPDRLSWDYCELGTLAWLDIPEDEIQMMYRSCLPILNDEKNRDDIHTLKIYLESNMNYSVTADKMYIHINTVRKRIDRITGILKADWTDSMDRMKIELMLQLLKF